MASSVSSERTFSAAGITISKRRSRLKADIVEALECLKCLIRKDLLFRKVDTTNDIEKDLECSDDLFDKDKSLVEKVKEADGFSWDDLIDDDDDEAGEDKIIEVFD